MNRKFYIKEYQVWFRRRNEDLLIDDFSLITAYRRIKNTVLHWAADPFILFSNGKHYIFAEWCNRITGKGSIAYCCLDDYKNIYKWRKCIKNNKHLSFPNIFLSDNNYYIIPESSSQKQLLLFKASSFPSKWILDNCIETKCGLTDSVLFNISGNDYLFSYDDKQFVLFQYAFDLKKFQIIEKTSYNDLNKKKRPAGKIFDWNSTKYFPTQNCSNYYGEGIIFNIIKGDTIIFESNLEINATYLNSLFKCNTFFGIHTFNFDDCYEVVDVYKKSFNFFSLVGKFFSFLRTMTKRNNRR